MLDPNSASERGEGFLSVDVEIAITVILMIASFIILAYP